MKLRIMTDNFAFVKWKMNFDLSTKSDTYRIIKIKPKMEKYLEEITDFRYIKILTKFRLSDHNLMIEEGRRKRPKIERIDRLCKHCDKDAVDDEIHFLLSCTKYTAGRNVLLEKISHLYPNFNTISDNKSKFIFLLTQENIEVTKMLAIFIRQSFQVRDSD